MLPRSLCRTLHSFGLRRLPLYFSSFAHSYIFLLPLTPQPLHSFSLGFADCSEFFQSVWVCLLEGQSHHFCWNRGRAFGLEGWRQWCASVCVASHKSWMLTAAWAIQGFTLLNEVAATQTFSWHPDKPHSHSYSALGAQYRLPLLTSLIAFSQSRGYVFDESIEALCMAKQAEPIIKEVLYCIVSFPHYAAHSPFSLHYLWQPLTYQALKTRL